MKKIICLGILFWTFAAAAGESGDPSPLPPPPPSWVEIHLIGIERHEDFRLVQEILQKQEAFSRLVLAEAGPKLFVFRGPLSLEPASFQTLIEKNFEERFRIESKTLPTGTLEINFWKKTE